MKFLILQHTQKTPPGSTLEWLIQKQLPFEVRFASEIQKWQSEVQFEALIICGGVMNVDQEDKYPWLHLEKNLIRQSIQEGKKILGLCLGAQLLAEALGAQVQAHTHWETGWHPVRLNDGSELMAFEWHKYTFSLPSGADLLATNNQCFHQGFRYRDQILATQFHPEVTRDWVIERSQDPAPPGPDYVQTPEQILAGLETLQPQLQKWFFNQLDQFFLGSPK
ncbi:MAG: type 1 glutamine amidotransferase [Pseudobdellovibrionaceae bacterium]